MLKFKPVQSIENNLSEVTVAGNEILASDAHMIWWSQNVQVLPGQVVKITTSPNITPRIYSVCSSMNRSGVGILFTVKPEGVMTPLLAELKKGDKIWVSKPYGSFLGSAEEAWWIATGTGIAPFKTMLEAGLSSNKLLIHGARQKEHFYFREAFHEAMGDRYIRCCSRGKERGLFEGRVSEYLKQLPHFPKTIKYYLCGHAEMVVEVRDLLIDRGIPYPQIISEIYF